MESATGWRNSMIKELRKKLTLLYTVTTGTILTLVVAGLLFYNLRVSEKDALQTFQNQIACRKFFHLTFTSQRGILSCLRGELSALLPEMQTREHYKRPELQGGKNLIINHQPDAKTQC